jgi:hypothetical protein
MSSSITQTLFHWMKEKRIIAAVAKCMGIPYTTLVAELRSGPRQAKLGADRLVPLFNAIRDAQYGTELEGMVKSFVRELEGEQPVRVSAKDYGGQVLTLVKCIGVLSESSARVKDAESERELIRLKTMIRAEIIPAVYKLEDIIDRRLARRQKKAKTAGSVVAQTVLREGA